jgi:tetratricopeptide (TPR) repeat protein
MPAFRECILQTFVPGFLRDIFRKKHPEENLEIKYSKKKQEMRQDPFLDFLAKAKEFGEARGNALTAAGIAVCLVIAGVLVYGYLQRSGEAKAVEAFGKAMVAYSTGDERSAVESFKAVVDNNKNSPQAAYSAYVLGSIFLREQKYDEAVSWFTTAASGNSKAGFVVADAQEGLAECYEAKGNREEALKCLSKALDDSRLRYRLAAIAWKAALISRELGKPDEAAQFCKRIESDTTSAAAEYRQKARNLIETITVARSN